MAVRPPTRGERRLSLAAILTTAFGIGLSISMATPLVSLTMERAGYGEVVIGLAAAVYSLAMLATGPFVPGLMRRFGPVPVLVGGLGLAAATVALFPVLPVLAVWLLLRAGTGIGNNIGWVVSETWINAVASDAARGRVVALYATVWASGIAAGPVLLSVIGTTGAMPFVVAGALVGAALVPAVAARRLAPSMGGDGAGVALLGAARAAPLAYAAGFLSGVGESTFFSLFPVYAVATGYDAGTAVLVATAFGVGAIALQPPTGWLADRVDRRRLLIATVLLALACVAVVPTVLGTPALWPVIFVWGGAVAGFYTLGLILVGQTFRGPDLAPANAAFIMTYVLGMTVGPLVGGGGMQVWSPHGLLAVTAGAYILFLAAAARLPAPAAADAAERRPG